MALASYAAKHDGTIGVKLRMTGLESGKQKDKERSVHYGGLRTPLIKMWNNWAAAVLTAVKTLCCHLFFVVSFE